MSLGRYDHFCHSCRQLLANLDKAFVIDDKKPLGFCSESCIISFYRPFIESFELSEKEKRAKLGIEDEVFADSQVSTIVEQTLEAADETSCDHDDFGNSFHYLHREFEGPDGPIYCTLVTKFFDEKPSFLVHHIISKHTKLIDQYKILELTDNQQRINKEQVIIDKTVMEDVGQMKSELLAKMLELRRADDIALEKFTEYEQYLEFTLSEPDEVFEYKDEEDRSINISIKAFSKDSESFFYYVIALKVDSHHEVSLDDEVLVPVLSFPSIGQEIYFYYKKGSKTMGKICQ